MRKSNHCPHQWGKSPENVSHLPGSQSSQKDPGPAVRGVSVCDLLKTRPWGSFRLCPRICGWSGTSQAPTDTSWIWLSKWSGGCVCGARLPLRAVCGVCPQPCLSTHPAHCAGPWPHQETRLRHHQSLTLPQPPHSASLNSIHRRVNYWPGALDPLPCYSCRPQSPDQTHWAFNTQPSPGSDPSGAPRALILLPLDAFLFKVRMAIILFENASRCIPCRWRSWGTERLSDLPSILGRGQWMAAGSRPRSWWPPRSMPFLSRSGSFWDTPERGWLLSNGSCTGSRAGRNICFLIPALPPELHGINPSPGRVADGSSARGAASAIIQVQWNSPFLVPWGSDSTSLCSQLPKSKVFS